MSFFRELKEKFTETGKIATGKAKNAKEFFKLKEQVRSKKKEIRTLTYKIGQTYLDLHGEDYEEEFGAYIRGIQEAQAEMEAKEKELSRLKEQIKSLDLDDDDDDDDDDDLEDFIEEEIAAAEETADAVKEEAAEIADTAVNLAEEAAEAAAGTVEETAAAVEEAAADAAQEITE